MTYWMCPECGVISAFQPGAGETHCGEPVIEASVLVLNTYVQQLQARIAILPQSQSHTQRSNKPLVEPSIQHKVAVAADAAVTRIYGWPWDVKVQKMYAACCDAITDAINQSLATAEARIEELESQLKEARRLLSEESFMLTPLVIAAREFLESTKETT